MYVPIKENYSWNELLPPIPADYPKIKKFRDGFSNIIRPMMEYHRKYSDWKEWNRSHPFRQMVYFEDQNPHLDYSKTCHSTAHQVFSLIVPHSDCADKGH